jgi:CBS domain-containing protein
MEMLAKDIMETKYKKIEDSETVNRAISLFDTSTDVLIAFEEKKYQGIVTERSILRMGIKPNETKIRSVMLKSPKIDEQTPITEVSRLMIENDIMQIPVFKEDKVIGIISASKVVEVLGKDMLSGKPVEEFMSDELIVGEADDSLGRIITVFREYHISRVPIVEESELVGVISMHDVLKKAMQQGSDADTAEERSSIFDIAAENIMSSPVEVVALGEKIDEVINRMSRLDISSIIVVDENNTPLGIITKKDILEKLIDIEEEEQVHVQIASKVSDLDRKAVFDEIARFVEKHHEYLGRGTVYAYITKLREKTNNIPLMFCRMKMDFENFRVQIRAEGFGEEQVTKNSLRKAKTAMLKSRDLKKRIRGREFMEHSELDALL